ncbi:MAG: hypothetical protein ACPG4T_06595, partial [Nannocystaceae bacterium]
MHTPDIHAGDRRPPCVEPLARTERDSADTRAMTRRQRGFSPEAPAKHRRTNVRRRLYSALTVALTLPLASCGGAGCQPQSESARAPSSGPAASAITNRWHYTVRPDKDLQQLAVSLCFDGPAPAGLVINGVDIAEAVVAARVVDGPELVVDREAERIDLANVGVDACISYTVSLDTVVDRVSTRRASRIGENILLTLGTWLWRPTDRAETAKITMSWELPPGMSVSHPFAPAESSQVFAHAPKPIGPVAELSTTTFRWRSQVAFGPFEVEEVKAAGATFSIASLGETNLDRTGRATWVRTAAETVALLFGKFPVPRAQILVIPAGGGTTPVVFGLTSRGGGASVAALVSNTAGEDAFTGEWVLIHEFLHLGMPFLHSRDVWLSEGFVTYYTGVLRTRAGFRSQLEGWRSIVAGLGRGARSAPGQTLAEASAGMHEQHAYDRVYWGGAAIA